MRTRMYDSSDSETESSSEEESHIRKIASSLRLKRENKAKWDRSLDCLYCAIFVLLILLHFRSSGTNASLSEQSPEQSLSERSPDSKAPTKNKFSTKKLRMTNPRTSSYCNQNWARDVGYKMEHTSEFQCQQDCLSDAHCTGISWATELHEVTNVCVQCRDAMVYGVSKVWKSWDKESDTKYIGISVIANATDEMFNKLQAHYPDRTSRIAPFYDYESYVGKISEDIKNFVSQEMIDSPAIKIIGTTKAHIRALMDFEESEHSTQFIIEADTIFASNADVGITMEKVLTVLRDLDSGKLPYDMIYLGWCQWAFHSDGWNNKDFGAYNESTMIEYEPVEKLNYTAESWWGRDPKPHETFCLHAYAVKKSAASTLIRYHHTFSNLDEQIPDLINNGKIRAARLKIPLFYQDWQFEKHAANYGDITKNRKGLMTKYGKGFYSVYWWIWGNMHFDGLIRMHAIPSISEIKTYLNDKIVKTSKCKKLVKNIDNYDILKKNSYAIRECINES